MIEKIHNWVRWVGEGKLGGLNAALTLAAIYCILQACIVTSVSWLTGTAASIDDAEQLIYVPYLWAGYGGSQPPLFTWIFWTFAQVIGPNLLTLKIIKYLLLFLTFFSVHRTLTLLGFSLLTASAGALGMMTMPQIFWESQHTLTHSVAALAFSALAVLALVNLVRTGTTLAYLLFGVAAALSMLSKFNDSIFMVAILLAAISVPAYRAVIVSRRFLLSIVAMLLVLMPTIIWSVANMQAVLARTRKLGLATTGSFLEIRATGFGQLLESIFNFTIMTLVIAVVAFALERQNPLRTTGSAAPDHGFIGRAILFSLAVVVVLMVVTGTTAFPDRWLTPFLFLLPAWIAIRAQFAEPRGGRVQVHFLAAAIAVSLLAMPASWYKQAMGGEGKSRSARMDHAALLTELEKGGPVRTILGQSSWIGNFRLVAPSLVLLNEEVPGLVQRIEEPAVIAWLDQACPPLHIWLPLRDAGYRLGERVSYIDAPESFGGSRRVAYIRLVKDGDPAASQTGRMCSEWWRERR